MCSLATCGHLLCYPAQGKWFIPGFREKYFQKVQTSEER